VLGLFVPKIMASISAHQGAPFLIAGGKMELYRSEGFLSEPQAPPAQLVKKIYKKGERLFPGDDSVLSWPNLEPIATKPFNSFCVPLMTLGKVTGIVLLARSSDSKAFSKCEVEFARLASSIIAPVIETP